MNKGQWLKERKKYIGGSDIGAILGLNPYCSALDIYLDKTSDYVDNQKTKYTYWGKTLEDVIANEYSKVKKLDIECPRAPIYHPKYSFLAANIDRWVNNKEYILECKTASAYKEKEWGEEGTDQIPDIYLCQIAWYRAITNVNKVDLAVLIGGNDFRIYTYYKNEELEDKLIKIGHDFWINNVLKNVPPSYSKNDDIAILYPRSNGKEKNANSEIVRKVKVLKSLKEEKSALENTIDELKREIKEYMQDYDILINEHGEVVASWKNTSPRSFLDVNRFKKECQDIYLKYVDTVKHSRVFLVK